ncbi:Serine/threonine-protein phosphatase 6 catalytic subunit [Tritrichomonas foetus]|uniref:Serine/threonine-protein phosphatase n=1 Tax=Tritrichomonas foetus TaxID=1144522 RepID=A0A1J4KL93_9EUKA|nr:Serine/threonine-protein phosphatase 6 catalytic subunit [Tritrichomonas foetus]|eukprot:OHT11712.1 Serine/threonine-protein phosphatase 6 catalytic subunit [Tritrichomonas foetus]
MDLDQFIENVRAHKPINEADLVSLFRMAADILYQEGTLISLTTPITVCGDVHGQFYDVLYLFEKGGQPPDTKYLFLGDYVDRGYYSIETFSLLLAYKVKYPERFFMLRGNHECRQVNQMYGFYEEIVNRFGHPGPYKLCNELFDFLPMAAVIDNKIFCVHGGLSPDVRALEQIAVQERRQEIPSSGPISDLCWSDPEDIEEWGSNQRGAGYLFGKRPTHEFIYNNKLKMIARAHQLAMDGYQWFFDQELVTVWSAPNYMYRSGNKASVMQVAEDLSVNFEVFDAVPDDQRVIPSDRVPSYFA